MMKPEKGSNDFESCGTQFDENANFRNDGVPMEIHVRIGVAADESNNRDHSQQQGDGELQDVELEPRNNQDILSILTDDNTHQTKGTTVESTRKHDQSQGVNRVVDALRSIQIPRPFSDKQEDVQPTKSVPSAPKSGITQRFFPSLQRHSPNTGAEFSMNREKPLDKSSFVPGESSGKSSLKTFKRFLKIGKSASSKATDKGNGEQLPSPMPSSGPGHAFMGEEDTMH